MQWNGSQDLRLFNDDKRAAVSPLLRNGALLALVSLSLGLTVVLASESKLDNVSLPISRMRGRHPADKPEGLLFRVTGDCIGVFVSKGITGTVVYHLPDALVADQAERLPPKSEDCWQGSYRELIARLKKRPHLPMSERSVAGQFKQVHGKLCLEPTIPLPFPADLIIEPWKKPGTNTIHAKEKKFPPRNTDKPAHDLQAKPDRSFIPKQKVEVTLLHWDGDVVIEVSIGGSFHAKKPDNEYAWHVHCF